MHITSASLIGGRTENQDAALHFKLGPYYVLAIADGLGGYSYGKEAAQAAVAAVQRSGVALYRKGAVRPDFSAILSGRKDSAVARDIFSAANDAARATGGQTTLLVAICDPETHGRCAILNAGDCTAFGIRKKPKDQRFSFSPLSIRQGQGNYVTRSLGSASRCAPAVTFGFSDLDGLVLVSDGCDAIFEFANTAEEYGRRVWGSRLDANQIVQYAVRNWADDYCAADNATAIVAWW